jgi:hypothetical protein
MLRPIEFDTARDPWSCQTHQCRLDHVLTVKEIKAGGLVVPNMNPAADLGQDHHPDQFVLKMYCLPTMHLWCRRDAINERQRVHSSAAALINPAIQKHRISVRLSGRVGHDLHRLLPCFDGTGLRERGLWQHELWNGRCGQFWLSLAKDRLGLQWMLSGTVTYTEMYRTASLTVKAKNLKKGHSWRLRRRGIYAPRTRSAKSGRLLLRTM